MVDSAAASSALSKPRVLLSILKCSCFDHLEGESLFTAITAGYGRFDCDRLLKPSGVELMNLPPSANIEVSVWRRLPADKEKPTDKEKQKQLLYHGLVALSALPPVYFPARGESSETGGEGVEPPPYWESWLGVFGSEVNLTSQPPDRVFQRCLEMGSSGARLPRLLLRLQYLPPGASAASIASSASAASALGSRSLPPSAMPPPSGSLEAQSAHQPRRISSSEVFKAATAPAEKASAQPAQKVSVQSVQKDPQLPQHQQQQPLEALQEQLKQLERRAAQSSEKAASQEDALRGFFEQAGPSLSRLGRPLKFAPKETAASVEASRAQLAEIAAALTAAERAGGRGGAEGGAAEKDAATSRSGPGIFYKPVKTDPVDCMLAAAFLRLEAEPPASAAELARVEPGVYRLGASGPRLRCHISGGRVMAQPLDAGDSSGGAGEAPLELFALLRSYAPSSSHARPAGSAELAVH